jgi:hypothetical protein
VNLPFPHAFRPVSIYFYNFCCASSPGMQCRLLAMRGTLGLITLFSTSEHFLRLFLVAFHYQLERVS